MQLFYTNEVSDNHFSLAGDDHRHCSKVLRKKPGDGIIATDGKGRELHGTITEIKRDRTILHIDKTIKHLYSDANLDIAIAPTKNMSRFEWFLEKATEVGIRQVFPISCRYSERKHIKIERCEKILSVAMKQSVRFFKPTIANIQRFKSFVEAHLDYEEKFIAYVKEDGHHLKDVCHKNSTTIVLIGPEGGFSEKEIDIAVKNGYKTVSLGKNRYRTETAGIMACHIINLENV